MSHLPPDRERSIDARLDRLLSIYPAEYRARFGEGIKEMLAQQLGETRTRGRWAVALFWVRAFGDAAWTRGVEPLPARWSEQLAQDVRFGMRTIRSAPVFALTAVLTLALATGASTAVFSVVSSVLLRPLPFADPDRLVQVRATAAPSGLSLLSWADLAELREHGMFETLAAYQPTTRHLESPSGPERLTALTSDQSFFELLGVPAAVGRTFMPDDPPDVVVISWDLWRRRFGADASIAGSSVVVDGRPHTVVGVMPEDFQYPYGAASLMPGALPESRTDLWVPYQPPVRGQASHVTGRLRPGITREAATDELRAVAARLQVGQSGTNTGVGLELVPLAASVTGRVRGSLALLALVAVLVLAAACTSVANLLLARAAGRNDELMIKGALGATRTRLARQLLTEGLLLSGLGGLIGCAAAVLSLDVLVALGDARLPRAQEVVLSWESFALLLLASVGVVALFGTAPALAAMRSEPGMSMGAGVRGHTRGRGYGRLRDALVVSEVAFAFVLSVGAATAAREAVRLGDVQPGIATANVLSLHLTPAATAADYEAIVERVGEMPGVESAGFTQLVPLQNWGWEASFSIEGAPPPAEDATPTAGLRYVTPGYFVTLGIPVVSGRGFTAGDDQEAPPVIAVNQELARRYFAGDDPVGKRTDRGMIVGVVGDVKSAGLHRPVEPELYYPMAQNVTMASDLGMSLLVRSGESGGPSLEALRSAIAQVNPSLAVSKVRTMDAVLSDSLGELNTYRWLVGASAGLAAVLAAIGLYGVTSYSVTSRTRELAVRLALGSGPSALTARVLGRAAALAVAGLLLGTPAVLALAPWTRSLSFPIRIEPDTYVAAAAGLIGVALIASLLPALRASSVPPSRALRHD